MEKSRRRNHISSSRKRGGYSQLFARIDRNTRPKAIPLKSIHHEISIEDDISVTRTFQIYQNPCKDRPVEMLYKFAYARCPPRKIQVKLFDPISKREKIFKSKIEVKETAFEEYDDRISEGQQAVMVDSRGCQVVQFSLGNVPPLNEVRVEFEEINDLEVEKDRNRIYLKTHIQAVHYRKDYGSRQMGKGLVSSKIVRVEVRAKVTSSKIILIESPSHNSSFSWEKKNDFWYGRTTSMINNEKDIEIRVLLEDDLPVVCRRSAITTSNEENNEQVTHKLTFMPTLTSPQPTISSEMVILMDRSGSMKRQGRMENAKTALSLLLRSLDPEDDILFNIVSFGSTHKSLFPTSKRFNSSTFQKALKYVESMKADMKGTDIYTPLHKVMVSRRIRIGQVNHIAKQHKKKTTTSKSRTITTKNPRKKKKRVMINPTSSSNRGRKIITNNNKEEEEEKGIYYPRQVFLITDGEDRKTSQILRMVRREVSKSGLGRTRIFSIGIGSGINPLLLDGVSRNSLGRSVFIESSSMIQSSVMQQLHFSLQPAYDHLKIRLFRGGRDEEEDVTGQIWPRIKMVYPYQTYCCYFKAHKDKSPNHFSSIRLSYQNINNNNHLQHNEEEPVLISMNSEALEWTAIQEVVEDLESQISIKTSSPPQRKETERKRRRVRDLGMKYGMITSQTSMIFTLEEEDSHSSTPHQKEMKKIVIPTVMYNNNNNNNNNNNRRKKNNINNSNKIRRSGRRVQYNKYNMTNVRRRRRASLDNLFTASLTPPMSFSKTRKPVFSSSSSSSSSLIIGRGKSRPVTMLKKSGSMKMIVRKKKPSHVRNMMREKKKKKRIPPSSYINSRGSKPQRREKEKRISSMRDRYDDDYGFDDDDLSDDCDADEILYDYRGSPQMSNRKSYDDDVYLERILSQASINGVWSYSDELVRLLMTEIKVIGNQNNMEKNIKVALENLKRSKFWMTALVIVVLREKYSERKTLWNLIVKKSMRYLQRNEKDGLLEMVVGFVV